MTGETLLENVNDIVEGLQRLAEDNAQPIAPGRLSTVVSPKKRNTVHALIENHDKRTKMPANFDAVFRQNLQGPSGINKFFFCHQLVDEFIGVCVLQIIRD